MVLFSGILSVGVLMIRIINVLINYFIVSFNNEWVGIIVLIIRWIGMNVNSSVYY